MEYGKSEFLNGYLCNSFCESRDSITFYLQSSGECLHVLDSKESMLTSCAFSFDNSLIATGKDLRTPGELDIHEQRK